MEILYRSFDGVVFKSAEECVEHEQKHLLFKMWNEEGRTNNVDGALVVWISSTIGAIDRFKQYCADYDCTTEGLEYVDHGLVYWDSEAFEWRQIESGVVQAFMEYSKDEE
jgi:hypothetical protein